MEAPVGKVLEEEGFALLSPDCDRGAHSVIYRCRVMRPRPPFHLPSERQYQGRPISGDEDEDRSVYDSKEVAKGGEDKEKEKDKDDEEKEEEEAGLREGQLVRVKVLNVSLPLPRHLSNFQHEHQVVAESLRGVAGVVRILARLSRPGVEALVVEDFGGESLDKWLAREGAFASDLGRFLALAVAVARTLGRIHSRSVVHKDIKPHNIIWNKETGEVKITDFGIASIVVRSKDTTSANYSRQFNSSLVHHVLGSLPYLAPELSLRSGDAAARPADHRSDFYSLGVTFFELLTGSVPFHERSAVRMMHAHMAKQAAAVHEVDGRVPRCVSAVVGRLLAKSVEERYQSSRGLVADLLRCERIVAARQRPSRRRRRHQHQHEHDGQASQAGEEGKEGEEQAEEEEEEEEEDEKWAEKAEREFKAGEDDVSDVFAFPAKLYGREDQIAQLKRIYTATAKAAHTPSSVARNEVVLVAGYSGVGKTALVGQLKEIKQQAYFISGKYDFNKRDVPYSAIVAAFTDMINQILAEDEESVSRVRERLREAVGSHGRMLVSVIPSLQLLIGEQPAMDVEIGASAIQELYSRLFSHLVDVFSSIRPNEPLVMILDDLHWADQPSFNLLQKILCRKPAQDVAPFFLLGGYRDNEVTSPAHPFWMFFEELRSKHISTTNISLQPLRLEDVNMMVADVLHYSRTPEATMELSTLVYEKTKGNPFFTISFLTKLHQNSHVWFNNDIGRWEWDLAKIQAMQYAENVVEFMAQDLGNLPERTLSLLKIAAFFGGRFDIRDIAQYCRVAVEEDEHSDFEYRFLHDRVQQAAYMLVPKELNKRVHLEVAQFLLTKAEKQGTDRTVQRFNVFDVAYHFNKAAELITDPEQRLLVARLNLRAAVKARKSMAYDMAQRATVHGIAMLPADCWDSQHHLAFQLHIERAQNEYLCKQVEVAHQLFEEILAHAKDVWETIEVFMQRNQMSICLGRYDDMMTSGLRGLAALGLDLPPNASDEMVDRMVDEVNQLLTQKPISELLNNRAATDDRVIGIQKLVVRMSVGGYLTNPTAFTYVLTAAVNKSIEHGHTEFTPMLYAWYGWVGCAVRKRYDEAYAWGKLAIDLCDVHYPHSRLPDRSQMLQIVYGFIHWLRHPLRDSIKGLETGYKDAVAAGNPAYASGCAYALAGTLWAVCPLPQILSTIGPYKRYVQESSWGDVTKMIHTVDRHTRLLLDSPVGETEAEYEAYINSSASQMPVALYHRMRMQYCYIMGWYSEALEAGQRTAKLIKFIGQWYEEAEFYFMYSLSLLAACKAACEFVSPKERLRELNKWRELEKETSESKSKREARLDRRRQQQEKRKRGAGGAMRSRSRSQSLDESTTFPIVAPKITDEQYQEYLTIVAHNQEQMKRWADSAPCNFLHQYTLVEAERAWVRELETRRGKDAANLSAIVERYEQAYTLAIANGFTQDAALAKELSWQVLTAMANQASRESSHCYAKWGAHAAAQKSLRSVSPLGDQPAASCKSGAGEASFSTSEIVTSALDLDTVVQATQNLSSKLKLNDLLASVMTLIVVNTGASKGVLLLTDSYREEVKAASDRSQDAGGSSLETSDSNEGGEASQLFIRAKAKDSLETQDVQVKMVNVDYDRDCRYLPNRILNYCWHTKKEVILSDALADDLFAADDYVVMRRPRSVMCAPIALKDKHRGLVYLENDRNAGVFGKDRLRLVQILTGQLMNSLDNALLVDRLRRANRDLRRKNKQLQEIDKVKDAFLAVASHELRTPLNGIIGMASLMDDTEMSEQQEECLTDIKASSETLLELVNDVLDLSKLKAMKVTLKREVFELETCLEESLDVIEQFAAEKGINLAYVIDNDVPKLLKADSARLQQIVVSLLNYSVKLMTSGEIVIAVSANRTVSLSPSLTTLPLPTEPPTSEEEYSLTDPQSEDQGFNSDQEENEAKEEDEEKKAEAEERRRDDAKLDDEVVELHFQVKISELLISEEECNMLFKPFSSHSAASQFRQMGGAGLGLYLSKKLCRIFGGKVWAERGEDGSVFHFTVNLGVQAGPQNDRRASWNADLFRQKRLLLFLHNHTNAHILHAQLSRAGAAVAVAKSRDDFVRFLQLAETQDHASSGQFDAVVVDVASLERVKILLLSLSQLLPLVVAATAVERAGELVRQMRAQYSPLLHVMHLPLRQSRLLAEWQDVLASFQAGRSPAASST